MKAADDEFVQAGINARRQKVEQENNLAEPSSPSANFSKEKTPEEIAKMTPEEHERYEKEYLRRQRGGSGF
jgi:DNA-nicking Smr family endonuclease